MPCGTLLAQKERGMDEKKGGIVWFVLALFFEYKQSITVSCDKIMKNFHFFLEWIEKNVCIIG